MCDGAIGLSERTHPTEQGSGSDHGSCVGTALLVIDVINDLAFEGSAALVAQAERMATRLATLKRRVAAAGMPTIYINDNFGQWRSDFRKTVAHCTSRIETVLKGNVAASTHLTFRKGSRTRKADRK